MSPLRIGFLIALIFGLALPTPRSDAAAPKDFCLGGITLKKFKIPKKSKCVAVHTRFSKEVVRVAEMRTISDDACIVNTNRRRRERKQTQG